MVCPNCETNNPAEAKFCWNCGTPLPQTCSNCGTQLPPVAKFCFNCGQPVAQPVPERAPERDAPAAPSRLDRNTPPGLLEKLNTARARGSTVGERRVITILFCDVANSTSLAQQFDPEEWAEIMNEAFEYLINPVYRYEGTVARLMGDGILAFFGAPIAHEDDPQRAVLAGLDIVTGIQTFREQFRHDYELDFNVRVGINTGPVVVGEVGSDQALEYTAMGDAINLASRMEATALPGTVQISEHTYRLVAQLFDVWDAGRIPVKGKSEPVQVFRVLGWQAKPGRTRGIGGLESLLVGRQNEMDVLRQAVDALRVGRGGIVCLLGEAGMGKSRLIEELSAELRRSYVERDDMVTWLESRSLSYEHSRPYGLLLSFVRGNLGITDTDSLEVVRAKIAQGAAALAPDQRTQMAHVVEVVLGVETETDTPQPEGEGFKRELFDTLLTATRTVAMQRPTVMVCDDLHWTDPASIELLVHLFQLVEEVPLLFLCAFREYSPTPAWQIVATAQAFYPQRYTEIRLGPLTEGESARLAAILLALDELPVTLHRLILEKTEGNPLFVEEVVRALLDSGALMRDKEGMRWNPATPLDTFIAPDNVQSLLVARIDRLDRAARRTLELAAVVGRTFQRRVLEMLTNAPTALDEQLDALQRADLIYEVTRTPEIRYAFRHALTRDAAYESILHRRRRGFHRRVGDAIEALFIDRLEEEAHRLAYHFDEGGDDERALIYYSMAGDHAMRIYANDAAVEHYSRAIEIAVSSDVDRAGRDGDFAAHLDHLYKRRGRTLEICGRYDDALANYRELENLARRTNNRTMELAALIPQATLRSTFTAKFDPKQGRSLAERALALAQELKDYRAEAKALWNLMLLAHYADDDQQQALAYGEKSLALARTNGLREELAYTLHDIANAYLDVGRKEDARAAFEEAGELWRELKNLPMLVDNLANSAWGCYQYGDLEEALARVDEGLRVSRSIGSLWGQAYSLMTLCPLYLAGGAYTQAIQALEEAIPLANEANFDIGEELTTALGGILGFLGDLERSVAMLEAVRAGSERHKDRLLTLMMLAQVYLHHNQPAPAAAAFEEAQVLFKEGTTNPTLSMYRMVAPVIEAELALSAGAHDHAFELASSAMSQTKRRTVQADLLRVQSQALLATDRVDEAHAALIEARSAADTPDADRMTWLMLYILWSRRTLWKVLWALGEVQARRGNQAEAEALRTEARELIASIAKSAPSTNSVSDSPTELQAGRNLEALFLALPDVREVMREPGGVIQHVQ